MKNLEKNYDPKNFEDRIYKDWEENGYFTPEIDENKEPFTIVMPPPNVTGNLHLGHAMNMEENEWLLSSMGSRN